ncbi:MAG: hypothetical protein LCH88_09020 [Proteobacteria bacterium]|nr:hypothetical protein [Pseudomonadota bacterium]
MSDDIEPLLTIRAMGLGSEGQMTHAEWEQECARHPGLEAAWEERFRGREEMPARIWACNGLYSPVRADDAPTPSAAEYVRADIADGLLEACRFVLKTILVKAEARGYYTAANAELLTELEFAIAKATTSPQTDGGRDGL